MPNFHPVFSGLPLAFLLLLLVIELAQIFKFNWFSKETVLAVLVLSTLTILCAFLSGYQGLDFINRACFVPDDIIELHHGLGKLLLGVSIVLLVFGFFRIQTANQHKLLNIIYRLVLLISLVLVCWIGYLGGQLVFQHGLAVKTSCPNVPS